MKALETINGQECLVKRTEKGYVIRTLTDDPVSAYGATYYEAVENLIDKLEEME